MLALEPGTRFKLIGVGLLGLVLTTGYLLKDLRDYRQAGSRPSDMTMTQVKEAAARTPFALRWVRLTEPLQLECSQARKWKEDGTASIVLLAFDVSGEQAFWLEYKGGNQDCTELKRRPLEGLLVEPDKFWIKQGMIRPSSPYPLVELKVGSSPSDLMRSKESWVAADLVFIAMVWLGYVSRPRRQAISAAHEPSETAAR